MYSIVTWIAWIHVQFLLFQKKLHTLTMESERLKSEIASRQELLAKIDAETKQVEEVSKEAVD